MPTSKKSKKPAPKKKKKPSLKKKKKKVTLSRTYKKNSKKKNISSSKKKSTPKKKRKYFPEIDLLKASAALLVVLIHVLAWYKKDSDNFFYFWDYIHFSVGIFVMASGFLFQNSLPTIDSFSDLWAFLVKKFKRIVVPYYIFAVVFALVMVLTGREEFNELFNAETILETIFLNGGVGNNWIPRLFMSIMVVVGIERLISKRFKEISYLIFGVSLAGTIYLMTRDLNFLSVFNNLPGWLVIFYTGRFIYKNYNIKTIIYLFFGGLIAWLLIWNIFGIMGLDTGIYNNKYPPNLYFVGYNIAASVLLWAVMYALRDVAQRSSYVWNTIKFISVKSYEIFFYHLIIIAIWPWQINWFVDWIMISATTILVLYGFKYTWAKLKEEGHFEKW